MPGCARGVCPHVPLDALSRAGDALELADRRAGALADPPERAQPRARGAAQRRRLRHRLVRGRAAVEPAVFRSITPAWNNRNLQNLARVVASDCILAHVRAATQSSGVNEANCHPFRWRPLSLHAQRRHRRLPARAPQAARERLRRGVRQRLRQHGLGAPLRAVHRLAARARRATIPRCAWRTRSQRAIEPRARARAEAGRAATAT